MTKDEIKEAIIDCKEHSNSEQSACSTCPFGGTGVECMYNLRDSAIGVITEQDKEIKELKAENQRLRQEMRDADKFARNVIEQQEQEIERLNGEYDKAFERLKSQQREIERLKDCLLTERTNSALLNRALKDAQDEQHRVVTEHKVLEEFAVKQAKIEVLEMLKKERTTVYINDKEVDEAVFVYDIDELIEEVKAE